MLGHFSYSSVHDVSFSCITDIPIVFVFLSFFLFSIYVYNCVTFWAAEPHCFNENSLIIESMSPGFSSTVFIDSCRFILSTYLIIIRCLGLSIKSFVL